jgi:predicted dehydrogenase
LILMDNNTSMKMRVAIIGSGAVGSIHAANLAKEPAVEVTAVYSRDAERASSFASRHGIRTICNTIAEAARQAEAVIICSSTDLHFEQARECLRAGLHTLVELPPCGKLRDAEELGALADKQGVLLGCAHTSRYLSPYARIQTALDAGSIGEIQEISYVRYLRLRASRTWTDNALLHHAAHAIDLVLRWCGGLDPIGCAVFPNAASAQSASMLARLPSGKPMTITVSYGAKLPVSSMVVVGAEHTIETDGFGALRSDLEELQWAGDEAAVYERAIRDQDMQFVGACRGKDRFIPWAETVNLIRVINEFQALSGL